jgi:hypothetical protein
MSYRELTVDERVRFIVRHPSVALGPVDEQGDYIEDEEFGIVLVYAKADGQVMYVQTSFSSDPSAGDLQKWEYVLSEFWKSLKSNTKKVISETIKIGSISISAALIVGAIVLIIVYLPKRQ